MSFAPENSADQNNVSSAGLVGSVGLVSSVNSLLIFHSRSLSGILGAFICWVSAHEEHYIGNLCCVSSHCGLLSDRTNFSCPRTFQSRSLHVPLTCPCCLLYKKLRSRSDTVKHPVASGSRRSKPNAFGVQFKRVERVTNLSRK